MDIGYGDCTAIGGFPYTLMLMDRKTRFRWLYGLKTLTHDGIVAALIRFHTGDIPE